MMKNNKMWEIKGQSLLAIILTLLTSIFVAYAAIFSKNIVFFILSILIFILWGFSAFKMTILKGDKESVYLLKYWSKKQIWKIPFIDIKKIHISYLSDTTFNIKNVYFFTSYGSFNCRVYGIYLSDFIKLFNTYDIPVYKEIEGKYILISD